MGVNELVASLATGVVAFVYTYRAYIVVSAVFVQVKVGLPVYNTVTFTLGVCAVGTDGAEVEKTSQVL